MSFEDWQSFLQSRGAAFENDWLTGFTQANDTEQDLSLMPLTQLACIDVSGEDASSFLQNQLSNDINALSDTQAQLSAYCSAKGRVLSLFYVIKTANSFLLLLPRDRLEATIKRLRMFVLMSKVTIEDGSDQHLCLGVSGDNSAKVLSHLGLDTVETAFAVSQNQGIAVRLPEARYLLLLDLQQAQSVWNAFSQEARLLASRDWVKLDIEMGLPQVYQATSEAFVPQMLNLHSLNGISFSKGCYPGQEVVARMKYLGKLKRRMYLAELKDDHPPAPGEDVLGNEEKAVGTVVDVAPLGQGQSALLMVLQVAHSEEPLHFKGHENILKIKDLPYTVELEG